MRIKVNGRHGGGLSGEGPEAWPGCGDQGLVLMMKEPQATTSAEGGPRKINIVVNWLEELKQRAPTGKK